MNSYNIILICKKWRVILAALKKRNIGKTEKVLGQKHIEIPITIDETQIQNVKEFEYLSSLLTRIMAYSKSHEAIPIYTAIEKQSNKYQCEIASLMGMRLRH